MNVGDMDVPKKTKVSKALRRVSRDANALRQAAYCARMKEYNHAVRQAEESVDRSELEAVHEKVESARRERKKYGEYLGRQIEELTSELVRLNMSPLETNLSDEEKTATMRYLAKKKEAVAQAKAEFADNPIGGIKEWVPPDGYLEKVSMARQDNHTDNGD